MKKFINILFCAIVAMVAMSCGNKVEKDIKNLVTDEFKVCDVKSVSIKEGFYAYTNEYIEASENYESAKEEASEWASLVARTKALKNIYSDSYGSQFDELYTENKASLDSVIAKQNEYHEIMGKLQNSLKKGNLYVAKPKGKDEITGKPYDFFGYQIFTYDSDGSLHQVDTGKDIQIIYSVYPKAQKDFEKAMQVAGQILLDAFSDLDI